MFKVNVTSAEVFVKTGTSPKTGPYSIPEQKAWIYFHDEQGKPNQYPSEFTVVLGKDQEPYPVGEYVLRSSSFSVGRFGQLQIRPYLKKLEEVKQPVKAVA